MSAEWTASLLSSGEFSDFTIECDGQLFKVHKSIVCSQSPVIKAALSGNFEVKCTEAKNNHVQVDGFSVETVQSMLNFMYSVPDKSLGETDQKFPSVLPKAVPSEAPTEGPESAAGEAPHQSAQTPEEEASADLEKQRKELIALVWTNAIADYYQVPKLCNLANKNIGHIIQKKWSPTVFLEVAALVSTSTGDVELHYLLTRFAAEHIDELVESKDQLLTLTALKDFSAFFMACSAQRVAELKSVIKGHSKTAEDRGTLLELYQSENIRSMDEIERTESKVQKCLDAMAEYATCRHCEAALKSYFSDDSTLRCRKCKTRH